jgi:hypothetical protein
MPEVTGVCRHVLFVVLKQQEMLKEVKKFPPMDNAAFYAILVTG